MQSQGPQLGAVALGPAYQRHARHRSHGGPAVLHAQRPVPPLFSLAADVSARQPTILGRYAF